MEIRIQAIHFDATERLHDFIQKKVVKLEKYSDDIVDAEVTLKVIKPEVSNNKEATILLKVKGNDLFANKVGDTFEEAIDLSAEALERQLLKLKEKR